MGGSLVEGSVGLLWGCPCAMGPVCAGDPGCKSRVQLCPGSIQPGVGSSCAPGTLLSSGLCYWQLPLSEPCAGALVF